MRDAKLRFVLGAIDPEMLFIQRALAAAGLSWEWACPRASGRHGQPIRRHAAAYDCENVGLPERGLIRVWVECRPGGLPPGIAGRQVLESRHDVVVDHHQPGDRGYSRETAEAFEGSRISGRLPLCLPSFHGDPLVPARPDAHLLVGLLAGDHAPALPVDDAREPLPHRVEQCHGAGGRAAVSDGDVVERRLLAADANLGFAERAAVSAVRAAQAPDRLLSRRLHASRLS
jgi:hypothetical protein